MPDLELDPMDKDDWFFLLKLELFICGFVLFVLAAFFGFSTGEWLWLGYALAAATLAAFGLTKTVDHIARG